MDVTDTELGAMLSDAATRVSTSRCATAVHGPSSATTSPRRSVAPLMGNVKPVSIVEPAAVHVPLTQVDGARQL